MDEKESRNKKRTSEEYRQEAENHIESLKQEWKVFGGTGIIGAKSRAVEFRTYGSAGAHDDVLNNIMKTEELNGFRYYVDSQTSTSPEAPSINWLLSDEWVVEWKSKEYYF